jgi:hypothetical protein
MKTIIFLFLFSFSTISSVHSESGQQWLSYCESNKNTEGSYCFGYLGGLIDMYSSIREDLLYFEKIPYLICLPPNMTLDQMVKIMRKYLNDNPEQLHINMTTLYQRKMFKTFPCKKQDKK